MDLRNRTAFAAGHAPGTLNFGLDGAFATYLGWLIPWGTPVTLLGETAEDVAEAQRELVRIGIDRPAAHATGGPEDWSDRRARARSRPATFADLAQVRHHREVVVLDVRRADEHDAARIDGAVNIPLHELPGRVDEVPDGRGVGALRRRLPRLGRRLDARRRRAYARRHRRRLRQRREGRAAPGRARGVTLLPSLALVAGALIGLSLGALGGGGSILAVPVLVYALGQSPAQATTGSLVVVGVTSLIGAVTAHRAGQRAARPRPGLRRSSRSAARPPGAGSAHVPEPVLLAAFAALMLLVGGAHGRPAGARGRGRGRPRGRRARRPALDDPIITFSPTFACQCPRALKVLVTATAVGLLTGFLGVGGGFLVVPALVLALALPMAYAAGTSLVVITLTSAAALAVRAGIGTTPDWGWSLALTAASAVGGRRRCPARRPRRHPAPHRRLHRPGARRRRLHRHPGTARPPLTPCTSEPTNPTPETRTPP